MIVQEGHMRKSIDKTSFDKILTALLCVVIFLINIRYISDLNGPHMLDDELGYLGHAASFAGKDWHEVMSHSPWFSYGWSIVLVPLFLLFSDMTVIYRSVNVINALLVVAVFLMQRHMLRSIFKSVDKILITAVSACVCFYPSVVLHTRMAWSETYLLFVFTLATLLLYRFLQKKTVCRAILFGAALCYLYTCHNRMIAVVIAGVIVVAALFFAKATDRKSFAAFLAALVACFVISNVLKRCAMEITWKGAPLAGNDLGSIFVNARQMTFWSGLENLFCVFCSQFFYFCVASFGMLPLTLYYMIRRIVKAVASHDMENVSMEMWLLLSFCGTLAVSSIFIGSQPISVVRIDCIFYGRYTEPVVIMTIGYGFLSAFVNKDEAVSCWQVLAWATGAILLALIADQTLQKASNSIFSVINAPGLSFFQHTFSDYIYSGMLFCVAGAFAVRCFMRNRRALNYAVLILFAALWLGPALGLVAGMMSTHISYSKENDLIESIKEFDTGDTPLYVLRGGNWQSYFQTMLIDIPLQYDNAYTLESIPEDEYYAIISLNDYLRQGFSVDSEIVLAGSDCVMIHVTGKAVGTVAVPLDRFNLGEGASLAPDHIHVEAVNEGYAISGPFISLGAGSYELEAEISISGAEGLNDYGALQVYSGGHEAFFGETVLTEDMVNSGRLHVTVPVTLDETVAGLEFLLQTRSGITYDVYGFTLAKETSLEYSLGTDGGTFATTGFSFVEGIGRWMNQTTATVDCFLPEGDHVLTVDISNVLPAGVIAERGSYLADVYLNDHKLGSIVIDSDTAGTASYRFDIPETYEYAGTNTVSITCEELWSPADYGGGDTRQLGLFIDKITFERTDG